MSVEDALETGRSLQAKVVWLVTIGEPLPVEAGSRALRCRLLARELARRGHDVIWWTSDFDHFAKRYHRQAEGGEHDFEGY